MNALKQDLSGKMIRVKDYPIPVRVVGGNGAQSFTMGTKVFVKDEVNDQKFTVHGNDVLSVVPDPAV